MNRAQRRKSGITKAEDKAIVAANPEVFGPTYRMDIDVHMPKGGIWQRDEAYNVPTRHLTGRAPDALWQEMMKAGTEMLGLADDRFVYGLWMNLLNRMPDDGRFRMIAGLVNGDGMTIEAGKGEMKVTIAPHTFPPLTIDPQTGQPEKKTASGLILPGGIVTAQSI